MKLQKYTLRNAIIILMMSISVVSIYGQGTIKTPKNQTVSVEDGYDNAYYLALWEAQAHF